MGLWDHIKGEWPVLKQAPMSFAGLLILGIAFGFGGGMLFRSQEIANMDTLVRVKDAQRELTQQQLDQIKQNLKETPPNKVTITAPPNDKKANQLKNVFSNSGWDVGYDYRENHPKELKLSTSSGEPANTVENALKNAGVPFEATKTPLGNGTTSFKLSLSPK